MQSVISNVETTNTNIQFGFGNGKIVNSFKKVPLPTKIGNAKCKIV